MVAVLVRLRLTLQRNGLRRSTWRTVGLILGAVYTLGLVFLAWLGLLYLRRGDVQLTGELTTLGFAALTLSWLLLSLLVFGIDETVDPRWADAALPPGLPVQGNLDPLALIAGGEPLERAVRFILDALQERPHIFNLGHGIQQVTPIAHVEQLFALLGKAA